MKPKTSRDKVAVIDIGSNAVRLAVYDGVSRTPVRLHIDREICSLGQGMLETGKLSPAGVKRALAALKKFAQFIEENDIKKVYAIATAAVRDAADGQDFVRSVRDKTGIRIKVISGAEEARLSALGVMGAGNTAARAKYNGLIGDFGGGSLELIGVKRGKIAKRASLPIGSLRVMFYKTRKDKTRFIDEHLKSLEFLKDYGGKEFYALGGAWRALAPGRKKAKRYADEAVGKLVLDRIFKHIKPSKLIIAQTGLREGVVLDKIKTKPRSP